MFSVVAPETFRLSLLVPPVTVRPSAIVAPPASVVAPDAVNVFSVVAPETVSDSFTVSEPSLTPIPTARLRVPSSLAKIISWPLPATFAIVT